MNSLSSIFVVLITILFIALVITAICEFISFYGMDLYCFIQKKLIKNSSSFNKNIIGKLLIIFYNLYKTIIFFVRKIAPLRFDKNNSYNKFQPRFFAQTSKRNIFITIICFAFSVTINFISSNKNMIDEAYTRFVDSQIVKHFGNFIFENKWSLLPTFSVILILYYFFKDKFTNKIISEIHDEELKNIIIVHKELFKDFTALQNALCYNINHLFETTKNDGVIYQIQMHITEEFPLFEYDINQQSFKKKKTKYDNFYYHLGSKTYGYESISDIVQRMKSRVSKFEDTNPFYNTYTINKYINGLSFFDASWNIQHCNEHNLLCEEFFKDLYEKYHEHIVDSINNPNLSDEDKIKELNKLLKSKNEDAIFITLKTVEYAIEIEKYIYKFNKTFRLRTKREQFPFIQIFDKCK